MPKWEEKRLGEIAPFKYGKSLTAEKRTDGYFNVFSSAGICGKTNTILAQKGIVIGRKGSVGTVFYSGEPFFCIDTAFYVDEINSQYNLKFLYYYIKLLHLEKYNNDAAVPGLNRNLAHKLKIMCPDLPTQNRIADILSSYDDLIENNNRRIQLLEQTAQELYKEWFVRFRFPGHEKVKFENGLPEGWEIKRIGDIARVKSGYAFKSGWWLDMGVPVIKIKDIQGNTINFNDLSYVSVEHAELAKQFYIGEGDLLIALTGATIGKLALVPYSKKRMVVNQRVGKFFFNGTSIDHVAFLYMTLQQDWIQELIVMLAGSNAAQPNISPLDIEKIKITYNRKIVEQYNKKMTELIKQIIRLQRQNQNLATQRDLLLPRLMSRKLEV